MAVCCPSTDRSAKGHRVVSASSRAANHESERPPGHTVQVPASPHGLNRNSPYILLLLHRLTDNEGIMTMSRYPAHRNG